ncbi:MAG: DinB family protein [Candidatus Sumerlaeaceae bacterium]|nr:DinB family protein [Candidatus Sumerlaeaceae bacterium]
MLTYLNRLARYNQWVNGQLYPECAKLTDEIRKQARGGPYASIHGVLNHVLLADRLWLLRFRGEPNPFTSVTQELCADFAELTGERARTDADIIAWAASLSAEQLLQPFSFTSLALKRDFTFQFGHLALHIFTHQIHHRGQLVTYMKQAGCTIPVTDLLYLPAELV